MVSLAKDAFVKNLRAFRGTSVVFYVEVPQVELDSGTDDVLMGYADAERPWVPSQLEEHLAL